VHKKYIWRAGEDMKEKVDMILSAHQVVTCSPGHRPRAGISMKDVNVVSPGAVAIKGEKIVKCGFPDEIEKKY